MSGSDITPDFVSLIQVLVIVSDDLPAALQEVARDLREPAALVG